MVFHAPSWILHESIKLCHKNKWDNTTTTPPAANMDTDEDEDEAEDDGSPETHVPSSAESSWSKKLKDRMKTLFCMQAKGQYMTHVSQKESRQRDKLILRKLHVHISSGSEQDITPEAAWMEKKNLQRDESDEESDG
ncbi:hypothetical protein ZWY2020_037635 [Hordeum vulgare]|nr:hypothetical protein ZWY2020_037635 [Hordeum vulgare]